MFDSTGESMNLYEAIDLIAFNLKRSMAWVVDADNIRVLAICMGMAMGGTEEDLEAMRIYRDWKGRHHARSKGDV